MHASSSVGPVAARLKAPIVSVADRMARHLPNDATLMHWSLYAWLLCLLCLSPALWRIITRNPRNLDPIWAVVGLLAMNRLSFLARISPEISHATALGLAIAMAITTTWYQRWDKAASL